MAASYLPPLVGARKESFHPILHLLLQNGKGVCIGRHCIQEGWPLSKVTCKSHDSHMQQ